MISHVRPLLFTACLCIVLPESSVRSTFGAAAAAPAAPTEQTITHKKTPGGVEFTLWGDMTKRGAPTLIILSGTADDTLLKPTFLQAGRFLGPQGYLCVSIDLPCHGSQARPGFSSLAGWAKRAAAGEDFAEEFNKRMSEVLDYLIAEGLTDPQKVVACGTSRGGFLAIRFMAHDKRVKCAAGFAPVTDLRQLREFDVAKSVPAVDTMNLEAKTDALVGRPVFIVIGDRDERVSTDAAIRFCRALSAAAQKADVAGGVALHVLSQPKGHTTPDGGDLLAARWIHKVIMGQELPAVP
jgi:dienelactone hydrolase